MFKFLPWRFSALLPLLCLLFAAGSLRAQVLDDFSDLDNTDNIVEGILAVGQQRCDKIGFEIDFGENRIPFGALYQWTLTDGQGNVTQVSTYKPEVLANTPTITVSVVVCRSPRDIICQVIGFGSANLPDLSTFTIAPDFRTVVTDGGFDVGVTFSGNRCFEPGDIELIWLGGSDPNISASITQTTPNTFGSSARVTFHASGAAIGSQNFLYVRVTSNPFRELATAVYQVRVVGCCIGLEEVDEEMMSGIDGPETDHMILEKQIIRLPTDILTPPTTPADDQMQLIPNPARTFVSVQLNDGAESVRILDISGKEAKRVDGSQLSGNSTDIDVSTLPSGTYFVEARSADGQRTVKKLTVNR